MKTNRVITKYENKHPLVNDIALYNTRTRSLNAEDDPALGDLRMHKDQMERASSKVLQRESWRLPHTDEYNPYLPISDTNKPPVGYNDGGRILDERMIWHTRDRPYTLESDRAQQARALQPNNNPEIIERNRRQHESDDAFLRRSKKNRWVEDKMSYINRPRTIEYKIDSKPTKTIMQNVIAERVPLNVNDPNNLVKDYQGHYSPEYQRENLINDNQRTENIESFEPKGGLKSTIDMITSFFSGLLNRQKLKNDEIIDMNYDEKLNDFDLIEPIDTKERMYYKPNHVHVMKQGDIETSFPDENYDNTAVAYKTLDPTGVTRTNIILDRFGRGDAKIIIIQKREQDSIFINDGRQIGDDYVVMEIPIEQIDKKFRNKIISLNMDTERDKALKLEYNDFVQFNEILEQHPDMQKRLKKEQLYSNVRGKDLEMEFENNSTFVDHNVYSVENRRSKINKHNRIGIHENYDMHAVELPIEVKRNEVRNADLEKYNSRNKGIIKGKFDKN